jgi:hypothetical protein
MLMRIPLRSSSNLVILALDYYRRSCNAGGANYNFVVGVTISVDVTKCGHGLTNRDNGALF